MVFYTTVIKYIASYLRPPFDFFLTGFHFGLFGHAVLQFFIVKNRAQLTHRILPVLRLVTGFGILNQDFLFLSGIRVLVLITQTNARFHFIYVLSTGTSRTESIPRDTGRQNIHFNAIVHQRSDKHGSKRSHTLTLRIVRGNTNQTVYTVFTFQISISIVAFDLDGTGFNTRFITFLQVGHGCFITIGLGITKIHTHQHRCPVLTLRATGTGVNLQHATHLVGFITKHILQLQVFHMFQSLCIRLVHLLLSDQFVFIKIESQLQFVCQCFDFVVTVNPLL